MQGRLLILIGLIVLLFVIVVVVVIPLQNDTNHLVSSASQAQQVPQSLELKINNAAKQATYNVDILVFPEETEDWKAVGDAPPYNTDHFYCKIHGQWHECYPIKVKQ